MRHANHANDERGSPAPAFNYEACRFTNLKMEVSPPNNHSPLPAITHHSPPPCLSDIMCVCDGSIKRLTLKCSPCIVKARLTCTPSSRDACCGEET